MPRPTILAHAVAVMREVDWERFVDAGGQVHVHGAVAVLPNDATVEEISAALAMARGADTPSGAPPVPDTDDFSLPAVIGGGPSGAPPPPA